MITVNGQPRDVPDGSAVAAVVAELTGARDTRGVAVAVNGEVVPRTSWETATVAAGDLVEVLTATQGG
ncbi:MAG: sulfur carrier protein ThiS [Micromonosporaceae bacterium]|nr:sulfur carrier protein ThiS [Micromonosporaceae bacterium]